MTLQELGQYLRDRDLTLKIWQPSGFKFVVWLYPADEPEILPIVTESNDLEEAVYRALEQWDCKPPREGLLTGSSFANAKPRAG